MAKNADNTKPKKPKKKKPNLLRITLAALMFFIQAGLLMFGIIYMNLAALVTYVILDLIAAVFTISIVYSERNSSFKLLWVFVVMSIPGLGVILYLFWGFPHRPRRIAKSMPLGSDLRIPEAPVCTAELRTEAVAELGREFPNQEKIAEYLERSGYPVYPDQDVKYYGLGDELFPDMMEAIEKAEKYVFI
jgi:cardiolipin synthase